MSDKVFKAIAERGIKVEIFDGDVVRENLSKGLGFSKEDRDENIKRIGFVSQLLTRNGVISLVAAISPYEEIRRFNRERIDTYLEVFCDCDLDTLIERDVKGLYKRALAGEIKNFTGISDPYENPKDAEIVIDSANDSIEDSIEKILSYLEDKELLPPR